MGAKSNKEKGDWAEGIAADFLVEQGFLVLCHNYRALRGEIDLIVRKDGIVTSQSSKANKTASIFIGIFVVAFVLLGAYVYFLHTKLQRASIVLSE